jgi:UDP-glucose 4-epimerase
LGSRIVTEFAEAGHTVSGVDRGPLGAGSLERYEQMELPDPRLADLIVELRPAVIVSAAGPASVADSMVDPVSDFKGTVGVLLGVLEAVRVADTGSKVIIMSSAAVYGDPLSLPVGEDAPLSPVSVYGFNKQIAETLLAEYHATFGVRSCAARVFSAYGPGLRRQLLYDVCQKALAGPTVRLFGTGHETRDFIHATDVARAVRVLAEGAPMQAEAYNVASGVETSVAEIARGLVAVLAPTSTIEFSGSQRPGDPLRWRADISAIEELGFEPSISIDAGLEEYALWCEREAGA